MFSELKNLKLDSREGLALLFDWARTHGLVLRGPIKELAAKHGVSTKGLKFSQYISRDPAKWATIAVNPAKWQTSDD